MRPVYRALTGIAVAPLSGAFGGALYGPVLANFEYMILEAAIVYGAVLGAAIGYAGAIVIGVPVFFFLRALECAGLWAFITAGALGGFVIAETGNRILDYFPPSQPENITIILQTDAFFALSGSLVATLFWLIARPDRYIAPAKPA